MFEIWTCISHTHTEKDEINVPMALSVFRDGHTHLFSQCQYMPSIHIVHAYVCVCVHTLKAFVSLGADVNSYTSVKEVTLLVYRRQRRRRMCTLLISVNFQSSLFCNPRGHSSIRQCINTTFINTTGCHNHAWCKVIRSQRHAHLDTYACTNTHPSCISVYM